MDDRRRFERRPTSIRVEISHPAIGDIVGFARDVSDGGASVRVEHSQVPPIGTFVDVVFKKVVGTINEEPVKMQVVYQQKNILGLMFCSR